MKFSIEKDVLSSGLQQIINVTGSKLTLPVLSNVLLEAVGEDTLLLSTTNLDLSMRCTLSAKVIEAGKLTVPSKKFLSIIRALPENEVVCSIENDSTLNITSGGSQFKVLGISAAEFPELPVLPNVSQVTIQQDQLLRILKTISYAQSKDENRYLMNGVYFSMEEDRLCLIATDGRRLALNSCEYSKTENLKSVIVPAKTIGELERSLGLGERAVISISDKQIAFSLEIKEDSQSGMKEDIYIVSKIIEGKYPNYKQVIPAVCENRIRLDRERFLEVIQRVSLVADEKNYTIKMTIDQGSMQLSAQSSIYGDAHEKIAIDYSGSEVVIGFNPQFLCDPLKVLDCDEVFFEFKDGMSPGVIRGNDSFLCVVMPLRI